MLVGQYETKLSPKRRVAVPNRLRKHLGKKIIVARWYEGCLVMVGESGWETLMQRLTTKTNYITQSVRDIDRFIMGSAFELDPDPQGRVILPETLTRYAKIKNGVTFVGLGDRVEVWDSTFWKKREEYASSNSTKLIEELAKDRNKG